MGARILTKNHPDYDKAIDVKEAVFVKDEHYERVTDLIAELLIKYKKEIFELERQDDK